MMKGAKIQFSDAEMELLGNADIILTKNKALEKMWKLLAEVQDRQADFIEANGLSNKELFAIPAKISKGENYLGLPYLILDYPRNFSPSNIFTIRTMFWWGRFFSSTLHASGEHLLLRPHFEKQYQLLADHDYYIGINQDPWQHHFEVSNYKLIKDISEKEFTTILYELPQIKIAVKWPLTDWHLTATRLFESWKLLLRVSELVS
jgi:hypothetical protein